MLYLNPPFHFINGVTLMPDHEDPHQWYYLPMAPHLTLVPDPSTGKPFPSIQLLLLRNAVAPEPPAGEQEVPAGGILSFDVNLGITEEQLSKVKSKLQSQANLRELPRLAPVPVIDGSVHLLLLGKQSEAPTPPPPGRPPPPDGSERFIVKIAHAAKPSLYGDEQAAFSVELTQDGAVVMNQALQGAITPIGVVYSLDYVALRPAYSVTLKANWDRVQTQLDERFGYDGIFLSVEVDEMVDKLIENRDIILEADNFVPEGEAGSTITDFQKAKAEVREMITSAFFTPSIDPPNRGETSGWEDAANTADRISRMAVTGGLSALGSFTYKKVDYTRIDKKSLDVTMRERSAVRRSIWPQGHLSGMTSLVRESGRPMSDFIIWIDLDHPFYKTKKIKLNPTGFTSDILSVTAHVKYGDDVKSVSFAAGETSKTLEWASVLDAQGKMVDEVEYHYTVNLQDVPGLQRPRTLESAKVKTQNDSIDVFPPDDIPYFITAVPITTTGTIPWDRWASVEVDLKYEDPDKGVVARHHEVVTKEKVTLGTWNLFRMDPDKRTFQARYVYRGGPDRQDHVVDWHDVTDEAVRIGNPFGRSRKVLVVPTADWNVVDRIFVDLSYDDPANGLSFQDSLEFVAGPGGVSPEPQEFVTNLVDPTLRRVEYTVEIAYKDGSQRRVPRSATLAERLLVNDKMQGTRVVLVRAGPGSFAAKDLATIEVSLNYVNAGLGVDLSDKISLTENERSGSFEFPFANDNEREFTYALRYRYGSGLSQAVDPQKTNDDLVVVPVK